MTKQSGPNQTDLDPHCLPLYIHKSIMSANVCRRALSRVDAVFADAIWVNIAGLTLAQNLL